MTHNVGQTAVVALVLASVSCSGTCGASHSQPMQRVETPPAVEHAVAGSVDIGQIVAGVGNDPIRVHEWVRSQTRFVPYVGSLRGPEGVLTDRRGNSLDRALLLAALIQRIGRETRLAHGRLTVEQATVLLAAAGADARRGLPEQVTLPTAELSEEPSKPHPSAEAVISNAGRARAALQAEFAKTVAASRAAFSQFRSKIRGHVPDRTADELRSVQDHWWVQVRDGAAWTDYDVSHPGGRPGHALPAVGEPVEVGALEQTLLHELEIRVVVEQVRAGEPREAVAFQHSLQPSKLRGRTMRLSFVAQDWPRAAMSEREAAERLATDAATVTRWVPTLALGSEFKFDKAFNREGDVVAINTQTAASTGAGGVVGAFDSALGGAEPEPPGRLTAVWVEFEVRSPGEPPRTIRREFLDLIGPAQRRNGHISASEIDAAEQRRVGLALVGDVEILPLVAEPSSESTARLIAESLDDCDRAFKVVGGATEINFETAGRVLAACTGLPGPLHRVALLRQMPHDPQPTTFIRSTNLLTLITRPRLDSGGNVVSQQILDLATTGVGAFDTDAASWFEIVIEQGLRDGVAESLAFGDVASETSTAGVFRRAGTDSGAVRLFDRLDIDAVNKLPLGDDAKARMVADLKSGYILVVAAGREQSPLSSSGWWRTDPRTGETVGVMDSGFNQTETGLTNTFVSQTLIWSGRTVTSIATSGVLGMLGTVMRFVMEKIYPAINGMLTPGSPLHRYLTIKAVEIHQWLADINRSPFRVFQR